MIAEKQEEEELKKQVPIGGIFQHYKGLRYKVCGIARHSEDLQLYVFYESLYDSETYGSHVHWIRPLKMFVETIEVEGQMVPRFQLIEQL
jgi:hypothetical protein